VTSTGASSIAITRRSFLPWLAAGAIAWIGVIWIGWGLWNQDPPRAGFDLALLLEGARAVAAGQSPYDPAMLAGGSPAATALFHSYPPPVAQAMQPVAWMTGGAVLVLWGLGATAGLGHIGAEIARRGAIGPAPSSLIGLKAILVAPLFLPFAVALLFGNLDAWFPLAYGALLLTILARPSKLTLAAGGAAVAVVAIAKLHPASLLLWIAARAYAERDGRQLRVLAAAALTGLVIVGGSVALGGIDIWLDYAAVVRAGAGADLVDPRNIGPVSLFGQLTGAEPAVLRAAQAVVTLSAVAVTVLAALRVRDPLASISIAFAASLVVLPVTWYHYPVALIPVGLALAILHPGARPRVVLSIVVAGLAIAFPVLLWVAVAILLVAAAEAARRDSPAGVTVDIAP
jgi:hypothetical protein